MNIKDLTTKKYFPRDFMWGASTSAHQVEGGNRNQWTEWEKKNADSLAKSAEGRLRMLPGWKNAKNEAKNIQNYISGEGVDHYNRYEEDFDSAKDLNIDAFRFSIEWSRIEPYEGVWDENEIEHYKTYLSALKKRGIKPIVCLWHWTLPVWFAEAGGFRRRQNLKYFNRFAVKVCDELLAEVKYVITLNEPNVYATFGYLAPEPHTGYWPPKEIGVMKFLRVYWNLTRTHNMVYRTLKKRKKDLQIGVAQQLADIQSKRAHNLLDGLVTEYMRYFWNWWFLNRTKKHQDFVGVNYYFSDYYRFRLPIKIDDPPFPLSDVGSYMEPDGLYTLLLRTWSHYKKPLIVTENGVADGEDQYRQWFIEQSIVAVEKALSEGVVLKGYIHWSLLDNFEWAYGWWPKYGLIEVDRKRDMKRSVRPSGRYYADQIKNKVSQTKSS